jgi:DNA-binding transcriptional MocR family regulator
MLSLQSNTVLLPDETLAELEAALRGIDVRRAATYADTWGDAGLREDVKRLTPNWTGEALIASSATQALMLSLQLVGRSKVLAIQVPCYFGVLRQAKELLMTVKPWQTVEELEGLGPVDVILLTSNLTPPSGQSMATMEKQLVANVATLHDAWVIEDNAYEPLWFETPPVPVPVNPARSIRIGSLSKIVSPDFRVGFVRAEKTVLEGLRARKITMELSTPRFIQEAARAGVTPRALVRWRLELKSRSQALLSGLLALGISAPVPDGGPYIRLPLLKGVSIPALAALCAKNGLLIDENQHQYPDGENRPYLRLHCGSIREADVPAAIRSLKRSLDEICTQATSGSRTGD